VVVFEEDEATVVVEGVLEELFFVFKGRKGYDRDTVVEKKFFSDKDFVHRVIKFVFGKNEEDFFFLGEREFLGDDLDSNAHADGVNLFGFIEVGAKFVNTPAVGYKYVFFFSEGGINTIVDAGVVSGSA